MLWQTELNSYSGDMLILSYNSIEKVVSYTGIMKIMLYESIMTFVSYANILKVVLFDLLTDTPQEEPQE